MNDSNGVELGQFSEQEIEVTEPIHTLEKTHHGWMSTTLLPDGYELTTLKRYSGKVRSVATPYEKVTELKNHTGRVIGRSVMHGTNSSLQLEGSIEVLESKPARVTKKVVFEQHERALEILQELIAAARSELINKHTRERLAGGLTQ